jgi:hypothetical protein
MCENQGRQTCSISNAPFYESTVSKHIPHLSMDNNKHQPLCILPESEVQAISQTWLIDSTHSPGLIESAPPQTPTLQPLVGHLDLGNMMQGCNMHVRCRSRPSHSWSLFLLPSLTLLEAAKHRAHCSLSF